MWSLAIVVHPGLLVEHIPHLQSLHGEVESLILLTGRSAPQLPAGETVSAAMHCTIHREAAQG